MNSTKQPSSAKKLHTNKQRSLQRPHSTSTRSISTSRSKPIFERSPVETTRFSLRFAAPHTLSDHNTFTRLKLPRKRCITRSLCNFSTSSSQPSYLQLPPPVPFQFNPVSFDQLPPLSTAPFISSPSLASLFPHTRQSQHRYIKYHDQSQQLAHLHEVNSTRPESSKNESESAQPRQSTSQQSSQPPPHSPILEIQQTYQLNEAEGVVLSYLYMNNPIQAFHAFFRHKNHQKMRLHSETLHQYTPTTAFSEVLDETSEAGNTSQPPNSSPTNSAQTCSKSSKGKIRASWNGVKLQATARLQLLPQLNSNPLHHPHDSSSSQNSTAPPSHTPHSPPNPQPPQIFHPISLVFTLISQLINSSFHNEAFKVYQATKSQFITEFNKHYHKSNKTTTIPQSSPNTPTPHNNSNPPDSNSTLHQDFAKTNRKGFKTKGETQTLNPLPFPPSLPLSGTIPVLLDAFAKQIPTASVLTIIQQLHADAEECVLYSQQHYNFELYRRKGIDSELDDEYAAGNDENQKKNNPINAHNNQTATLHPDNKPFGSTSPSNNISSKPEPSAQLDYIYSIHPASHRPTSPISSTPKTPSPYPYPFVLPVPSILTVNKRDIQQYANSIVYSTAFAYLKAADYYSPQHPNHTAQFDRRTELSTTSQGEREKPAESAHSNTSSTQPSTDSSPSTPHQPPLYHKLKQPMTKFSRQLGPRVNSEADFYARLMFNAKTLQKLPPSALQLAHDRVLHAIKSPLVRYGKQLHKVKKPSRINSDQHKPNTRSDRDNSHPIYKARYTRPPGLRLHSRNKALPKLTNLPFLSLSHQAALRNTLPTAIMLPPTNPLCNTPIISNPVKTRLLPYFLLPLHNMEKNPFAQSQTLLELASTLLAKHVAKMAAYGEQVDLFSPNPSQLRDPSDPIHVLTRLDIDTVWKTENGQGVKKLDEFNRFDPKLKKSVTKVNANAVPDDAINMLRDFIPPTISPMPRHSALLTNMLLSTYMKLEQHDKIVQFMRNLVALRSVSLLHGDTFVNQTTIDLLFTYITTHTPSTLSQLSVLVRLLHHTDTQKRFERAALSESIAAVNTIANQGPLLDPEKYPNRLQLDLSVDERGNVTGLYDITKRRQYKQQLEAFRDDPALKSLYLASNNLINAGVISHTDQISVPGQPDINRIQQLLLSESSPNTTSMANSHITFAPSSGRQSKFKIRTPYEIYGLPDPTKSYPIDDKGNIDVLRALQTQSLALESSEVDTTTNTPIFSLSFHIQRNNLFSSESRPVQSRYRGITLTDFPRLGGIEPLGAPFYKSERDPMVQLRTQVSIVPPENSGKLSLVHQRAFKDLSIEPLREEFYFPTKPAAGSSIKGPSQKDNVNATSEVFGPDGSKYDVHLLFYNAKPISDIAGPIPQQAYTYQVMHSGTVSQRMLGHLPRTLHPHHNHYQPEEFQQHISTVRPLPLLPQTYLDTYIRSFNKFHHTTGELIPNQSIFHADPPPGDLNSNILFTRSQYSLSPDERLFIHQARDGSPIVYLSPYQVNATLFGLDPSTTTKNVSNRTDSVVFNIHYKPSTVTEKPALFTYQTHPKQKGTREFAWHMSQQAVSNTRCESYTPNQSIDVRFQDFHKSTGAPPFQQLEPHYWGEVFSEATSVSIFRLPPPTALGIELIDRDSKVDMASLHRYKQLIDRHRTQQSRHNHPNPSSAHLPTEMKEHHDNVEQVITEEEKETADWVDLIYDMCTIFDSYGGDISIPILSLAHKMAARHNYFEGELVLAQQLSAFQKSYQIADSSPTSAMDYDIFGAFLNHDAFDLLQDSSGINFRNASPTSVILGRNMNSSTVRFNESKLYFDFFVEHRARTGLMMSTAVQQHPSILYGDFLIQTSQVAQDLAAISENLEHHEQGNGVTSDTETDTSTHLSRSPSIFFPSSTHFSHHYQNCLNYHTRLSNIVQEHRHSVHHRPIFGQESISHPNLPSHPLAIDQPNLFHMALATTDQIYPQTKVSYTLSLLEDFSRANNHQSPSTTTDVLQLIGEDFAQPIKALQWYSTAWSYLTDSLSQPPSLASPQSHPRHTQEDSTAFNQQQPPSRVSSRTCKQTSTPLQSKSPLSTLWFSQQHHFPKLNNQEITANLNQNALPHTIPNSTHGTFTYALRLLHRQQFSTAVSFVLQIMADHKPISRLLRDTLIFHASQNGELYRAQPRATLALTPHGSIEQPLHHNTVFWSLFDQQTDAMKRQFLNSLPAGQKKQLWDMDDSDILDNTNARRDHSDKFTEAELVQANDQQAPLTSLPNPAVNMLRAHVYLQDEVGRKNTPNGYQISRRNKRSQVEAEKIREFQLMLSSNSDEIDINPRHMLLHDATSPNPSTTTSVVFNASKQSKKHQNPRTVFEIPHTSHNIPGTDSKLWTDINVLMTHDKWCGFLSPNEYMELHKTLLLFDFVLSNHAQLGVMYSGNRKTGGLSSRFPVSQFNQGGDLSHQLNFDKSGDFHVGVDTISGSNLPLKFQAQDNRESSKFSNLSASASHPTSAIPHMVESVPAVSTAAVHPGRNDISMTLLSHTATPNTLALTLSGLESSAHNNQLYLSRTIASLDRSPLVPLSYKMTTSTSKTYSELPKFFETQSLMTKVSRMYSLLHPRHPSFGSKSISFEPYPGMLWKPNDPVLGPDVWDFHGPAAYNFPHYQEYFKQYQQALKLRPKVIGNQGNENHLTDISFLNAAQRATQSARTKLQRIFQQSLQQLAAKAFTFDALYTTSTSKRVNNAVHVDNSQWWDELSIFLKDFSQYQPNNSNLLAPRSNRTTPPTLNPQLNLTHPTTTWQKPGLRKNLLYDQKDRLKKQDTMAQRANDRIQALLSSRSANYARSVGNIGEESSSSKFRMVSHLHNRQTNLSQLRYQDLFYWLQQRSNLVLAPLLRHSVHFQPFPELSHRMRRASSARFDLDSHIPSPKLPQKQLRSRHRSNSPPTHNATKAISQSIMYNRLLKYKKLLNPANQSVKIDPKTLPKTTTQQDEVNMDGIQTLPTPTRLHFESGFQYYSSPDFQLKTALLETLQLMHAHYDDIKHYPRLNALFTALEDRITRPLRGTNRLIGVGQSSTDVFISPSLMAAQNKRTNQQPPLGALLAYPITMVTNTYLPPNSMTPFRGVRSTTRATRGASSDLAIHKHFRRRSIDGLTSMSSIHNLSLIDFIPHAESSYNGIITGTTTVLSGTGHRPYKQDFALQFSSSRQDSQRTTFIHPHRTAERGDIVDMESTSHPATPSLSFESHLDHSPSITSHQHNLSSFFNLQLRTAKIPYQSLLPSKNRFNTVSVSRKILPTANPNWLLPRGSVPDSEFIAQTARETARLTQAFPSDTTRYSNSYLGSPSKHFIDLAYQRTATSSKFPIQSGLKFTSQLLSPLHFQTGSFSFPIFARAPLTENDREIGSPPIPSTKFLFFASATFSPQHTRILKLFSLPSPILSQFSMDSAYAGGQSIGQFDNFGNLRKNTNIYTNPSLHPELGFVNLIYMTMILSLIDESLPIFTSKPEPTFPTIVISSQNAHWSTLNHTSLPFHHDPISTLIDQITTSPHTLLPLYSFERSPSTDIIGHTADFGLANHLPFAKPSTLPLSSSAQHLYPLTPSLQTSISTPQHPNSSETLSPSKPTSRQTPFQQAQLARQNALLNYCCFDDDVSNPFQPTNTVKTPLWLEFSMLNAPFDDNKTVRYRNAFTRSLSQNASDVFNTASRDVSHSHEGKRARDRAIKHHPNKTITAVRDVVANFLPADDQLATPEYFPFKSTLS